MGFDVQQLTKFAKTSIKKFATSHTDEIFYGFAIDAAMLCLNSEECATETLANYQADWDRETCHLASVSELTEEDLKAEDFLLGLAQRHNGLDRNDAQACLTVINESRTRRREESCKYKNAEGIQELRRNTGDWAYQGFAELDDEHGFDQELYGEHYDVAAESEDGQTPDTEYARAMTALIAALTKEHAFDCLKRTSDFTATWVDHDY